MIRSTDSTIESKYMATEVLVAVQRYDEPEIMIGTHEFNRGQYATAPVLTGVPSADLKIQSYLDEGFEPIDVFAVSQVDPGLYQLVRKSLPIEFHTAWSRGDVEMCERIRVFVKPETV